MEWGRDGREEGGSRTREKGAMRWGVEGRVGVRPSRKLQLAAAVQTGFMVIALAAGHNPQHQGSS